MIKLLIILLGVLSLITDAVIFFQIKKKMLRRTYFVLFVLLDICVMTALLLIKSKVVTAVTLQVLMWVIWVFIATVVPKLIYLLISWPDYLFRFRRRYFSIAATTLAFTLLVVFVYSATIGRNSLRIENVEVVSDRVPDEFDNYRIVHISDIHLGNYSKNNDIIERLSHRINELNADMVVFSGDLVNTSSDEFSQEYIDALSTIKSRDGVYAVLGNHDLGFYMHNPSKTPAQSVAELKDKIAQTGWTLLENDTETIVRENDTITISGVGYPDDGHHNGRSTGLGQCDIINTYKTVDPAYFNILISHSPNTWEQVLEKTHADVMLSGHVHSMQMKIGLCGRGWSPAKWMYEYWSGLYEQGKRYLYVNDGIGYVMYPMRIGTRPEITLITLKKE